MDYVRWKLLDKSDINEKWTHALYKPARDELSSKQERKPSICVKVNDVCDKLNAVERNKVPST